MTRAQAQLIVAELRELLPRTTVHGWEWPQTLESRVKDAERDNPALARAYRALMAMAEGVEGP